MSLEPGHPGVPLKRRNGSGLWMVAASVAVACLFRRPASTLDLALTCTIGGFSIWLTLGPGLNALKGHGSKWVRFTTLLGCLALCLLVLKSFIPWLLELGGA